jgi:hypothetical protein
MLSHHPSIVKNGLVAYFDAANPKSYPAGQDSYANNVSLLLDGESLIDKSANARTFTAAGGAAVSTANKKFGNSSIYCTGSSSYIYNSSFNSSFSGDFTIEFWAYHNSFSSVNILIHIGNESSGRHAMFINSSGKVQVDLYFVGVIGTFNTTISTGTWSHYVLTRSGTTVKLFVNGTLDSATISVSGTFGNANGVYIGAASTAVNGSNAYFDDIRITSGISRYTASFTPPTAPLSLPGVVTDLTKNRVVGTLTNGPTYSSANGGSIVFNGTSSYITLGTNSNLNFGTGDFTIDCWYNLSATTPNDQGILNDIAGTFSSGSVLFKARQNSSGGKVSLQAYDFSSVGGRIVTSSTTIAASTWYNATITRIGNSFTLYINGRSESTGTFAGSMNFNNNNGTYIGYSILDAANGYLNGRIPNIKIYKGKGLTSTEVLQNYNATKSRYGY